MNDSYNSNDSEFPTHPVRVNPETEPDQAETRVFRADELNAADQPESNQSETEAVEVETPPVVSTREKHHGWYDLPADEQVTQAMLSSDLQTTQAVIPPDQAATQAILPPDLQATQTVVPPSEQVTRVMPSTTGTPLPQHVDEVDLHATQVTPSTYTHNHPSNRYAGQQPAGGASNRGTTPPPPGGKKPMAGYASSNGKGKKQKGCLTRGLVIGLFSLAILVVLGISYGVIKYFSIASSLPDVATLRERAAQFETTRILDRNGNVLYEILDPNAGRRTYVPLGKISPYLIAATIATEDKDFYSHPGFDPFAIARALVQNYTSKKITSGASTITQQLARMLMLSPEERYEQSYARKAREIILAAEITRRYSKEEILELYLNEIYYGNLAYGVEAAAETYFNTTADKLTLAQATFLAGLPQAPSVYDIYTNRDETLRRHKAVLVLTYQLSQERDCIEVSTSMSKVCVDAAQTAGAATEIENYTFQQNQAQIRYPHWVNYIRSLLEEQFDAQTIYRSGFSVYTTLDPGLQDQAEQAVSAQISALADRHVTDGALVAIRPNTGEILAMVGSADFYNDAISGQVNMAVSPRQPGSSIKPLTYVAAFEKGWTPATLIWDVPTEFSPSGDPNDPSPKYVPVNYDGKFHGPVTVRTALANSYNIPAVKTLQYVGLYGSGGFIEFAKKMGITTLTRDDYGLSLTLGGGDVSLLELTSAYGIFANDGKRVPPVAITKIVDHEGKEIFNYKVPSGDQVIRPEHAFLISSILSDSKAREPMFGANSVLNLSFVAAAKTGTTNDYRDNWTLGYTPDLVTGVWVGNADYTPMQNTSGVTGAAPIWAQFMEGAIQSLTGGNPRSFNRPAGITETVICSISGAEPSQWCPDQRREFFAADQPPQKESKDLWQKVTVDTWTGLSASAACQDFSKQEFALNADDESARKWIRETSEGKEWAKSMGFSDPIFFVPDRECRKDDPRPDLRFTNLTDAQVIRTDSLDIFAVASASGDFRNYRLEWGVGENPDEWKTLVDKTGEQVKDPTKIYTWNLTDVKDPIITLRLYMESTEDTYAERRIRLVLQVPTPTPTQTPTATMTPTVTNTPEPSFTPTPTVEVIVPTAGTQTP